MIKIANTNSKYHPIVIPRNKKYGNNYWIAKGNKVGSRDIILYSDLEFDHWLNVECDPAVKTYCEQPLKISYVLNGKVHTTIFDMWILNKDGNETFVEVKYEKELNPSGKNYGHIKRQIEAQKEWCKLNNFRHEIRTESIIRVGRYSIENRLKLMSNINNLKKPTYIIDVANCITTRRKKIEEIYSDLCDNLAIDKIILATQWLYYDGEIIADLDSFIWGKEMEVWRK